MDGEPSAVDAGVLVLRLVERFDWPIDIARDAHLQIVGVLIESADRAKRRMETGS